RALARFAGRADVPEALRIEALRELGEWAKPSGRDRIVGLWRPLEARSVEPAADALRPALGGIFSGPDRLRQEAAKLAGKFGIKEIGPVLLELLADKKRPAQVRAEMLVALQALKDERLKDAMQLALDDQDPQVRTAGRRVQAKLQPQEALVGLTAALEKGDVAERQGAFSILAEMSGDDVEALLSHWLDKLLAHELPVEIQLDLLTASGRHATAEIKQRLAKFESSRPRNDHLANYREAIAGGDPEAGRRIFLHKSEVSCVRCHKLQGEGGEVGPDLTGIGARQNREYLLESIVDPNKQIAKGFETVVLGLKNGTVQIGIVKSEDDKEIRLMTADGKLVKVAKDQVEERQTGKSAMPEDIIKQLSKAELRDLVEFLARLKEGGPKN
ncbi:MAG TPA: c-type cytochrome, partial [Isosphaeraceae bacterium]|nr:c-type cytochrome [Isosphaeraceae bacterium]